MKLKLKLKIIIDRIYADYFMPSRMNEYENLIKKLQDNGYIFITFKEYVKKYNDNSIKNGKFVVSRHDIDTDISTTKEFFEIEKKYGIKATYYFRLSTLNIKLMKKIEENGSEASYHFEELAIYAKENHIKSKNEILKLIPRIEELFSKNFKEIENKLEYKIETICSHGDFANRKLNILNNIITKNQLLRKEFGILAETYDEEIMDSFDVYLSDGKYPLSYKAEDILNDCKNKKNIYLLTHPRQWKNNWICNTKENIKRIFEAMKW